jgi:putative acetyltransferase
MRIRPYHPRDVAALTSLFTDVVHRVAAAHYGPEQRAVWAPRPPDLDGWLKRLDTCITVIAEHEGQLLGFAALEPVNHLDLLYVHVDFQRQGIASALCRRIEQEALTLGATHVHTEASITALPFFEHSGYRILCEQTVERGGIPLVNYRMEKALRPTIQA